MKHIFHSFEKVVPKPNAGLNVKLAFPLAKIVVLSDGLEKCTEIECFCMVQTRLSRKKLKLGL
jgi:hypothetical protein